MTAVVLRGDAAHLPLPDASVDLIVTSPPYFGLRSYTDGGEHYAGQIGSEATPAEFVAALIDCTREWVRVLKPSGSLFVNLGDRYSTSMYSHSSVRNVPQPDGDWSLTGQRGKPNVQASRQDPVAPPKSLLGTPWRYALACTDQLGLILRAEIVWAKPNGLPESVTDRVRRSHEQLFHFTVRPRYFAAVDEIREAHGPQLPHTKPTPNRGNAVPRSDGEDRSAHLTHDGWIARQYNPLGKLPGSVWTIPSAPLKVPPHLGVDHFAAFPPALVRPIVLGWSPAGICTACGEGRRPVVHKALDLDHIQHRGRPGFIDGTEPLGNLRGLNAEIRPNGRTMATITGHTCACPSPDAPTRPAVVLDPFGGTGTTALVATVHGRTGITVDMSADYCRLAAWRTHDPAERARALDVPKPPPVPDGMEPLFSM